MQEPPIKPATWASIIVTFSFVAIGWHSGDNYICGAAAGFVGHWLMRWVDAKRAGGGACLFWCVLIVLVLCIVRPLGDAICNYVIGLE